MWDWVSKLEGLRRAGQPAVLATVVDAQGSTPREPGAKMLVLPDGTFHGTIGGGHLEQLALDEARAVLAAGRPRRVRYPLGARAGQCCGGVVEVFFDVLNTGPQLYVFGAGHVAQALARVLTGTPFQVHVVDEREDWLHAPGLPEEVRRHAEPWDTFVDDARWDAERTFAVVMTHRHDVDQAVVEDLVRRPARFLGLIGSRTKWASFRHRLHARGLTEAQLGRVQCPVGLDLGGKAPAEVALSIAGELLRVLYGRPALRQDEQQEQALQVRNELKGLQALDTPSEARANVPSPSGRGSG